MKQFSEYGTTKRIGWLEVQTFLWKEKYLSL